MAHSTVIGGTEGLDRVTTGHLEARCDIVSVIGRTEDSENVISFLCGPAILCDRAKYFN